MRLVSGEVRLRDREPLHFGAPRPRGHKPGAFRPGQPGDTHKNRSAMPLARGAGGTCIFSEPGRRTLRQRLANTFLQGKGRPANSARVVLFQLHEKQTVEVRTEGKWCSAKKHRCYNNTLCSAP